MRGFYGIILSVLCTLPILTGGCTSAEFTDEPGAAADGYRNFVVHVELGDAENAASAHSSRSPFDNFDNELDKWGISGENMEELRIIIINGSGTVEHNRHFTFNNAAAGGEYEFRVSDNDEKTILLVANENSYHLDQDGLELAGGTQSMSLYFERLRAGARADLDELRLLTLTLAHNSPDGRGLSLQTPLPIAGLFTERIAKGVENVERTYWLHRAAVKYSFRIVNTSSFDHTLESVRIDRIADREFLFPHAQYAVNEYGHMALTDYSTPATASEQEYETTLPTPLRLPAKMKEAVTAIQAFYVPEGLKGETPQKVSLMLDGRKLNIWRELKWLMPGETTAQPRPMVDLPRNTHVVVNITVTDDDYSIVAEVQPYSARKLDPNFGLARDAQGNIIIKEYPDGTYDVVDDNGETVTRDSDGDRLIRRFDDGSVLIENYIKRDYIHEADAILPDYAYKFEKDRPGGMMVLIRQQTVGDSYQFDKPQDDTEIDEEQHKHGLNDRPLFLIDNDANYYRVEYDDEDKPTLTTRDVHGDSIVQANGFQFRQNAAEMERYFGTYIVLVANADGSYTEELRHYKTGRALDWELGTETPEARAASAPGSESYMAKRLRRLNAEALKPYFRN